MTRVPISVGGGVCPCVIWTVQNYVLTDISGIKPHFESLKRCVGAIDVEGWGSMVLKNST